MKTRFNVELLEGYPSCAEKAVLAASMVNGGEYKLDMDSIVKMAETEKETHPMLNEDTNIAHINENLMHIDTKVNGEWKTVCRIELVEVGKLVSIDDIKEVF